ncbi:MAG: LamG-like jellyroll fold domain-containing protein, partial [Cyclobacteriaceae bacterium]
MPIIFHGEEPTERITDFVPANQLPKESFSIELWTVNHVNQPIGVLATLKNKGAEVEPDWLLGFYGKTITASLNTENSLAINHEIKARRRGNYWNYIVATYDGQVFKLYLNGELVKEQTAGKRRLDKSESKEIEVASYMKNEPYMDLGNMLKMLRIENFAITSEEINNRHKILLTMVEEGKLFPNLFHFNAGPYLNNATSTSMDIVWETDRPSDFVIMYGKQVPLMRKEEINTQSLLPEQ